MAVATAWSTSTCIDWRVALASVNKVILIGYLGADPELRSFSSGDQLCNLRIATTESWKDKATGEKREATEWHRVVLYRKLAEIAGQYLRKGSQIFVEGRIRTRKWRDKDGQDRYTIEIEADAMTILSGKEHGVARVPETASAAEPWIDEFSGAKGSTKGPDWLNDPVPF